MAGVVTIADLSSHTVFEESNSLRKAVKVSVILLILVFSSILYCLIVPFCDDDSVLSDRDNENNQLNSIVTDDNITIPELSVWGYEIISLHNLYYNDETVSINLNIDKEMNVGSLIIPANSEPVSYTSLLSGFSVSKLNSDYIVTPSVINKNSGSVYIPIEAHYAISNNVDGKSNVCATILWILHIDYLERLK